MELFEPQNYDGVFIIVTIVSDTFKVTYYAPGTCFVVWRNDCLQLVTVNIMSGSAQQG